jgi:uncharacterized membrane protein YbhN (UPF0104 family)
LKNWVLFQGILFGLIGIVLVYLTFSKVSFGEVIGVIQTGNFFVLIPIFLVSFLVLVIRVWRWKLLYKQSKIETNSIWLFHSLSIGYMVNFAIPRLGEITRTLILKKTENIPINQSLSTIVFERLADILALLTLIITAFVLEFFLGDGLLNHFTKGLELNLQSKLLYLSLFLLIVLLVLFLVYKNRKKFGIWFSELMESFLNLFSMPHKTQFIVSTVLIWLGFYLMTYLWIFMFPSSADLGMYPCFQVMVLGVIARTLPIQAGSAGAYHYVVSTAFILLGTNEPTASALAIVIHGFQSVLTLLFGIISYIWFLYFGNKK